MTSRRIMLKNVAIGGGSPITIQSMTNTKTADLEASCRQIDLLYRAGCEIIRLAVPDLAAAHALEAIVAASPIPIIADIHFDGKLALAAIESGVAGLRLNPGNLKSEAEIKTIAEKAGEKNLVIRVGSNSGSVDLELLKNLERRLGNFDDAMAEALVQSVLCQCELLEKYHFHNIKVSLKSSSVPITFKACRKFNQISDYPQHIGITEAGTVRRGTIKSAAGIGALLLQGIGDTLRVSLSADPLEEVKCAKMILECCGIRPAFPELISCPSCGRTKINLIELAEEVEKLIETIKNSGKTIDLKKIAVMGCIVNGPGEAREADLGIAGGDGKLALFQFGQVIGSFSESEGFAALKKIILEHVK